MSKPIKLNKTIRQSLLRQFSRILYSWETSSDITAVTPTIEDTLGYKGRTVSLVFTPEAYLKMYALVDHFPSEVAWHGVVDRIDGGFRVSDILVYPQEVTGANVTTDQKEYETWLMSLEDEVFNRLRFQGHSHVNFATSPSGVDATHQERILSQLDDEEFYIFLIVNKKHECYVRIADVANNTEYETGDVTMSVEGDTLNFGAFVKDASGKVKERVTTGGTFQYGANVGHYTAKESRPLGATYKKPAEPKKEKKEKKAPEKYRDYYDIYNDPFAYDEIYGGYHSVKR